MATLSLDISDMFGPISDVSKETSVPQNPLLKSSDRFEQEVEEILQLSAASKVLKDFLDFSMFLHSSRFLRFFTKHLSKDGFEGTHVLDPPEIDGDLLRLHQVSCPVALKNWRNSRKKTGETCDILTQFD